MPPRIVSNSWPEVRRMPVIECMSSNLPPPAWKRAFEADSWVAFIVLGFAVVGMAIEAFTR